MKYAPRIDVWPPLPFTPYARRPLESLPFPLEEPGCRVFSRARQGLYEGVKALGLRPGDEILVPAYHHGSEVEALVQAGLACRFYDLGEDSIIDEEELESLLGPRVKGLHLTHYLGIPQDAARWRAWCDKRGLLLIEDAAQAWLGRHDDGKPVGSHGDLAIFCLYKTFGIPDGAAVVSKVPPEPPREKSRPELGHVARGHASYLTQKWGWLAEVRRRKRTRPAEYDPEEDFALGDCGQPASAMASFLLPRATTKAQAARASNYAFLLEHLGRFTPEEFSRPSEGASPFAFPIQAEDKEGFLARLSRRGVVALNFWLVPHFGLPDEGFPRAKELRESVVGLPVHQELGRRELAWIVEAVRESL